MRKFLLVACAIMLATAWMRDSQASILYNAPWTNYSQNFDSLPNTPTNTSVQATRPWVDDATQTASNTAIPGWYLWHPINQGVGGEGGTNGNQRIRYGNGSSNVGSFYSFGTNASTDRALGSLASNTLENAGSSQFMGVRFTNNTGGTLVNFTLSYFGEEWRDGGATTPNAQSLLFGWKVTPSGAGPLLQDSGFNSAAARNFTSPTFTNTGGGAALDGNDSTTPLPINRIGIGPVTVTGIRWLAGTDLWLRWADVNNANNDHGLAIDDLNFSAIAPEPMSFLVWGLLAMIGLTAGRRYSR